MIKKTAIGTFVVALLLVFALPVGGVKASGLYRIENYDVEVIVTEDHTYKVEERISAVFTNPQHGIYRYIPYRFPELPELYPRIENLKVNQPFESSTSIYEGYRFLDVRIGDPEKTVVGKVEYLLSYDYLVGRLGDASYISYNLMGNMETIIEEGSFVVELPKEIDPGSVRFYQGIAGSDVLAKVSYEMYLVDGHPVIAGMLLEPIGEGEYLTLHIPVSDEYFAAAPVLGSWYQTFIPYILSLSALAFLGIGALWFRFGRDRKITQVLEFYPPDELTPLEIYRIYEEQDFLTGVTPSYVKESTSLIYHLANKGYLTIAFVDEKHFILRKTNKEPTSEKKHVKVFLSELFRTKESVSEKELEEDYYSIASPTVLALPELDLIDGRSFLLKVLGIIAATIPMVLAGITLMDHLDPWYMIVALVLTGISGILSLLMAFALEQGVSGIRKGRGAYGILLPLSAILLGLFLWWILPLKGYLLVYGIFQVSLIWSMFIKKRNDSALMLLGRVAGFREFLSVAKKNELEKLVAENPVYFYDILPYAHALGVSKVFSDKFKDIEMKMPAGYAGSGSMMNYWFLYHNLSLMNHLANNSVAAQIQASKSGFGGSGFGGGGFSGGGFGGGGGGTW